VGPYAIDAKEPTAAPEIISYYDEKLNPLKLDTQLKSFLRQMSTSE
jgi:hypothetical protein